MASVIRSITNTISEILQSRDTRFDHLPFTSLSSVILIFVSYIYFIKIGLPSYMSKREPYALRTTIIVYNIIQIVLNAALLLYGIHGLWAYKTHFNFACEPIDYGTGVLALMEARGVYHFYCLKLLDLCDTVFFVLRKKTGHVSFLHVYHHSIIFLAAYKAVGWAPGGHFVLFGLVNAFVHVVLYMYYLFTLFKPQQNITIKKMVTTTQMIQFVFFIFYFGRPLLNPDCPLPKIILFEIVAQASFIFCLFTKFWYQNYCVNQRALNKDK